MRSSRTMAKSVATSLSVSAALGSSRIRTLESLRRALAISTSWRWPTPRSAIVALALTSMPQRESSLSVSPSMRSWSTAPKRSGSCPKNTFSATVISGTRASSWWITDSPARSESAMAVKRCGLPLIRISPS